MESMRDMNRAIEREIQKGSCPLRFEQKGFGEYTYNDISSKEKLTEVLSYLLRIGEFENYATKMVMSNVYMDIKYCKQEYHRTHTALERKKIYAAILRSTKKLNPEYEGKVYLETVKCFFTVPPVEREKCKMTFQGGRCNRNDFDQETYSGIIYPLPCSPCIRWRRTVYKIRFIRERK